MAELKNENEILLVKAREERAIMMREAKETRDKIISEAKEQARAETNKIIAGAQDAINQQKTRTHQEKVQHICSYFSSVGHMPPPFLHLIS